MKPLFYGKLTLNKALNRNSKIIETKLICFLWSPQLQLMTSCEVELRHWLGSRRYLETVIDLHDVSKSLKLTYKYEKPTKKRWNKLKI